jgi:hypothetical protein
VHVSGGTPTQVQLSVSGGPWQDMQLQSWGDWTKSVHTPAGTPVQFRAVVETGTYVSDPYRWLQDNATHAGHRAA